MNATIRIDEVIFNSYPTFRRGIVIATQLQNQGHSESLENTLNEVISQASVHPIDLKIDPRITDWDEAHRQFGSNFNKFIPAHRNLLKRVQKSGTSIPFINKVVAIMNINSIRDVIPVGGDDLASAGTLLELRYSNGNERFTPIGLPETIENPDVGEVIYVAAESGEVMCRRWNWRNGHKTRITETTQVIVMNIDALGENSEDRAITTRNSVAQMLAKFCNAQVQTTLLSPENPFYKLEN
ncbi:B3/B4 domain-containing protein [Nostoc sp.]|uniref:B3/B4 domain-containing protein n=1 Tax=Nostoc sp. TaxID=1180 RepID=UPI002FF89C93